MNSEVYHSFGHVLSLRGMQQLVDDSVYVMLVQGYIPNIQKHSRRMDVTGEVTGQGYEIGGRELLGREVIQDTQTRTTAFKAADLIWPKSTITASGAVLYKNNGSSRTDELIAYVAFGKETKSENDEFRVYWNKLGVLLFHY